MVFTQFWDPQSHIYTHSLTNSLTHGGTDPITECWKTVPTVLAGEICSAMFIT